METHRSYSIDGDHEDDAYYPLLLLNTIHPHDHDLDHTCHSLSLDKAMRSSKKDSWVILL